MQNNKQIMLFLRSVDSVNIVDQILSWVIIQA